MGIERACTDVSYTDVVDRVLDKGIVVDAWMRVSIAGIDLLTIEAHLIVASIDTYLADCPACGHEREHDRERCSTPASRTRRVHRAAVRFNH
jgi:hypothetical protein